MTKKITAIKGNNDTKFIELEKGSKIN